MLAKLRPRSAYDVIALVALLVSVGTGGAYAANTIRSADIVDESIVSQDIRNGRVTGRDVLESSLGKVPDADTLDGRDSSAFTAFGSRFGDGGKASAGGGTVPD